MHIAENIRKFRRAADMTQEQLAETLDISVSAVSQWESGKTMPDISFIPALCSVLSVSSDELLGIDIERKEWEISDILMESHRFSSRGYLDEAVKVCEDGLKRFPDSFALMKHLAGVEYFIFCRETGEISEAAGKRAAELCERVLEKCTDRRTRESAVQTLSYVYAQTGQAERADELLDQLGSMVLSREVMAARIHSGQQKLDDSRDLTVRCMDELLSEIADNIRLEDGKLRYTPDETVAVLEKVIGIYGILFEEGDFGFWHTRLCDIERHLSYIYADRKDAENALAHCKAAAYHAIEFVKFAGKEKMIHTSLIFRGMEESGFQSTSNENHAAAMKNTLAEPRYDFIRGTAEFAEILAQLDEYAAEWQKRE